MQRKTEPETPIQVPAPPASDAAPSPQPLAHSMLLFEMAAVLAIAVVPHWGGVLVTLYQGPDPLPYWLDSINLIQLSGCEIVAVLYIISRSQESWAKFGIVKPDLGDPGFALLLLLGAELLWIVQCQFLPSNYQPVTHFPTPKLPIDYALMVLKYAPSAFAEELITRAYLITRLETLLKSPIWAVLISAVVFASYHLYYGISTQGYFLGFAILFGLMFLLLRRMWPLAIGHLLCDILADLAAA